MMKFYESLMFVQGDDGDALCQRIANEGAQVVIDELIETYSEMEPEKRIEVSWAPGDYGWTVPRREGKYVLSWRPALGYVGLTRVTENKEISHFNPQGTKCEFRVYHSERFPNWPHMGPCGHTEEHSHE